MGTFASFAMAAKQLISANAFCFSHRDFIAENTLLKLLMTNDLTVRHAWPHYKIIIFSRKIKMVFLLNHANNLKNKQEKVMIAATPMAVK